MTKAEADTITNILGEPEFNLTPPDCRMSNLSLGIFNGLLLALYGDNIKTSYETLWLLGTKHNPVLKDALSQVFSGRKWKKSIEVCLGTGGILCNHNIADSESVNDDDADKANFFNCIKENPLLLACLCIKINPSSKGGLQTLRKIYKKWESIYPKPADDIDIGYASVCFVCNTYDDANRDAQDFSPKGMKKRIKRIANFYSVSERIKNVKISNLDMFDCIESIKTFKDRIFIFDTPYLGTDDVYFDRNTVGTREFDYQKHRELGSQIRKLSKKCNFILCCRITVSPKAEKGDSSRILHSHIDQLYGNCAHFSFADIQLNKGVIERVITNFDFKGSVPYDASQNGKMNIINKNQKGLVELHLAQVK